MDERVQELEIAFGRLQHEGIDARIILADAVNPPAAQLNSALVATADVEDVAEPAVLLFEREEFISMHRFAEFAIQNEKIETSESDVKTPY